MAKQWRFCMALVREVLRLKFTTQKSNREIASIHSMSQSTAANYVARAKDAGLVDINGLNSTSDEELKSIIFPLKDTKGPSVEVDFGRVNNELKKKHVTLKLLWQELAEGQEQFYHYSRFCFYYR